METAIQAKKIFQVQDTLGYQDTFKLLAFVVKNFVDSIPVKPENKLKSYEIFEVVDDILKTYTHESIDDFILAFKQAKKEGKKFYGAVGMADLYQIISDYFEDQKPGFLESQAEKHKETERSQDMMILNQITEHNPGLADQLKNLISPLDANPEQKRKILSIYKNRKKRGLAVDSFEAYFNKQRI